jgi:predicted phosphodiesterase
MEIKNDLPFMATFQLVSDLHLEFKDSRPTIERNAENLILAGDVGYPTEDRFVTFMGEMCRKFDRVLYVTGNHEYYCGLPKSEVDDLLTELSRDLGFVFLNNSSLYLADDRLTVIGSTLWTETTPKNAFVLEHFTNDYRKILKTEGRRITSLDTGAWHEEAVRFLSREFSTPGDKLVITHHLPSLELIPERYRSHPAKCAFATSLDSMFPGSGVKVWCAGHTHTPLAKEISGIRFYVNPLGYPGENEALDTSLCTFSLP